MPHMTASRNEGLAHPATGVSEYRILVSSCGSAQAQWLGAYGEALARMQSARLGRFHRPAEAHGQPYVLDLPGQGQDSGVDQRRIDLGEDIAQHIRTVASVWQFDMLVAAWPTGDEDVAAYANLVRDLDITVALVRHRPGQLRRVIVPAGGGAHALEGIRVADALAKAWQLDSHVLRIVQPEKLSFRRHDAASKCRQVFDATRLYMDVANVAMPVRVRLGGDVVTEIIARSGKQDLIVIGGSSQWLMENQASSSIPSRVADDASGPVVMVLTNRGRPSALTDVFWDRTIAIDVAAQDRRGVIERLVDRLVASRQVPPDRRQEVLAAVRERDQAGPTFIGNETAIPHAALPGFHGLTGIMGVTRQPVLFGKRPEDLARFVFLLLTPKESYDVYLPILARVARLMNDPVNRYRIQQARSAMEAAAILSDVERHWHEQL